MRLSSIMQINIPNVCFVWGATIHLKCWQKHQMHQEGKYSISFWDGVHQPLSKHLWSNQWTYRISLIHLYWFMLHGCMLVVFRSLFWMSSALGWRIWQTSKRHSQEINSWFRGYTAAVKHLPRIQQKPVKKEERAERICFSEVSKASVCTGEESFFLNNLFCHSKIFALSTWNYLDFISSQRIPRNPKTVFLIWFQLLLLPIVAVKYHFESFCLLLQ